MEYQEERNLQSIANPNTELARGQFALADRLQRFGQFGMERYEDTMVKRAQEQAGKVVPSTSAPQQKSPTTVVGRVYNQTVLAGHNAAVRNDIYKHIDELVSQHGNDPIMLKEKAMAYKSATLNQVAPEVRGRVSTDFDALFNPALAKVAQTKQLADVAASVGEIRQSMMADRDQSLIALKNGDIQQQLHFEANFREYVKEIAEIDPEAAQEIADEYQNTLKPLYTYMGDYEEAHAQGFGDSYISDFEDNPPQGIGLDTRDEIVTAMRSRRTQLDAAEAEQKSIFEQQSALEVTKFLVESSEALIPIDQMMRQGKGLLEKQLISAPQFASVIGKYNRTLEKRQKTAVAASEKAREMQNDISLVESVVRGDTSHPISQKQVDNYYQYIAQNNPDQLEEVTKLAVENTRLVPTMLRDNIKAGIYSKDPAMVASATETIDWLSTVPGLNKMPFSDHELAYADAVQEGMKTYGMDEEGVKQSIVEAKQLTDPTQKLLIDSRKDRIIDLELNQEVTGKVEDMFSGWFGMGKPEIYESMEPMVRRDYEQAWERAYLLRGSESYADKVAESKVKRTYGKFQGTLMKYPPQYYYQAYEGDDGEWIAEQAMDDVREYYGDDFGGIILSADPTTDQTAINGKPAYLIQVVTEDGIETLSGGYWMPDVELQREKRRLDIESQYDVEPETRLSRTEQRETPAMDAGDLTDALGDKLADGAERQYQLANEPIKQTLESLGDVITKGYDNLPKREGRKGQMGRGE